MLIVLNNKCNFNKDEFLDYKKSLETLEDKNNTIILCPSTIHLPTFDLNNIILGAQNVSATEYGAYTGEVSASQLKSYKVNYCLVGHSERRLYQKETNAEINCKIKQLLKNNIIPILCVGENQSQRQENKVKPIIEEELFEAIKDLTEAEQAKIVIAYEPIWSIGTGLIPTPSEVEEVLQIIKNILPKSLLLYGGSVTDQNITTLKKCSSIDGYLLGGLSLKVPFLTNFLEKLTY